MNTKQKILEFLYSQIQKNNIAQIRKGMVEDFEAFILTVMADIEAHRAAQRMEAQSRSEDETTEVVEKAGGEQ
jgi:hypothetical protein